MQQRLGEIFLGHGTGHPELSGDLLERKAIAAVQDECRLGSGREQTQGPLELLDALLGLGLSRWIVLRDRLHFGEHIENVDRFRLSGLP